MKKSAVETWNSPKERYWWDRYSHSESNHIYCHLACSFLWSFQVSCKWWKVCSRLSVKGAANLLRLVPQTFWSWLEIFSARCWQMMLVLLILLYYIITCDKFITSLWRTYMLICIGLPASRFSLLKINYFLNQWFDVNQMASMLHFLQHITKLK